MTNNIKRPPSKSTASIARDLLARVPSACMFPITPLRKRPPLLKDDLELAFNDVAAIEIWAKRAPGCNWGLATNKSRLIVMDVDVKSGKVGQDTLDKLELENGDLPRTLTVRTPSGGKHYYFKATDAMLTRKVAAFGPDVDAPNYVLIPGCVLDGSGKGDVAGEYTIIEDAPIADAPAWFLDYLDGTEADRVEQTPEVEQDTDAIRNRCIDYLKNDAPLALQGRNGDATTLKVFGVLKDMGASLGLAVELAAEYWNGRCEPRWQIGEGADADRLDVKARNAYGYLVQNAPGSDAPEAEFASDPADPLPKSEAKNVAAGERQQAAERAAGKETWESLKRGWVYVGQQKQFVRLSDGKMWDVDGFEKQFGYVKDTMRDGMGRVPLSLTKAIFSCPPGLGLRTFDSFVFMPGQPEDYRGDFNQWRKSEIEPKQGPTDLWDEHLAYLFSDQINRDVVLDWMAWVYQNPTLHPNHSLLVQGQIQGTGKSLLPHILAKLISATPATPLSQRTLELDHNAWVLRTRLAIVEIRAANKKLSDILHDLITSPMAHVDMKGAHDFDIPNVMAFWLEANPTNVMTGLDNSDRRHAMVSTDKPNMPLQPREPSYYVRLYGKDGRGGLLNDPVALAAIAYALKNRDLKGYSGQGRAPFTEAKRAMMRASADPVERWMVEHHDEAPLTYSLVGVTEIMDAMPDDLRTARGTRERVADVLAGPEFNGENIGKLRIGGRAVKPLRLWAINRTRSDVSVRDKLSTATLVKIYKLERVKLTGAMVDEMEASAVEAAEDFAADPA